MGVPKGYGPTRKRFVRLRKGYEWSETSPNVWIQVPKSTSGVPGESPPIDLDQVARYEASVNRGPRVIRPTRTTISGAQAQAEWEESHGSPETER